MKNQTEQLATLNKAESEKLAYKIVNIYDILMDMTKYTIPEIDDPEEIWDEFDKKSEIHHCYTMLYAIVMRFLTCTRRSDKMKIELKHAINNAKELGLNVY